MKDLRKTKKNYIFELDNKQMTLIFAGLVVIGLLVFSAGAMIGSKMAKGNAPAETKADVRARIKAPALLKEEGEAETGSEAEQPGIGDIIEKFGKEKQVLSTAKKEGKSAEAAAEKTLEAAPGEKAETHPEADKDTAQNQKEHKKGFFIQVAAFQEAGLAGKKAETLEKKGYKTIVVKADIPGKGTWHRVRIGPFDTLDQAKSSALAFEEKEKTKTYIPMD